MMNQKNISQYLITRIEKSKTFWTYNSFNIDVTP